MLTATLLHIENSKNQKGDFTQQHIDIWRCGAGKYHLF